MTNTQEEEKKHMSTASILQRYGATVLHSTQLKGSRHVLDMFADRVRQASVEPTLMLFGQRLADLLDVAPSDLYGPAVTAFIGTPTIPVGRVIVPLLAYHLRLPAEF